MIVRLILATLQMLGWGSGQGWAQVPRSKVPIPFVMQMTTEDPLLQRRAFMQIQKVLADIGASQIEVVAYEGGILSLLTNNARTAGLLETMHRYWRP